jgi:hypothetical protein
MMDTFKLPEGWTYILHPEVKWEKPYGWYKRSTKTIEVWPCGLVPNIFNLRNKAIKLTYNHEVLHAWGNKGCDKPWCLGFESSNAVENMSVIAQLLYGLRFCDKCLSWLEVTK